MGGFDGISERFWRSLLSVVVAHAVAIQSLLIAVAGTAPTVFHRVNVAMVVVAWPGDSSGPTRLTRYTIASPRGPPLSV